jgi:hypothetical protein
MATRKGGKKTASKTAAKPVKTAAKPKAAKVEKDKRITASALMDRKSAEFKALSESQQKWIVRFQENGVAAAIKNLHRIIHHNKGLYMVYTTTGVYQVGSMSTSGKSLVVDLETEDINEAQEFYDSNRTGNYGAGCSCQEEPEAQACPR